MKKNKLLYKETPGFFVFLAVLFALASFSFFYSGWLILFLILFTLAILCLISHTGVEINSSSLQIREFTSLGGYKTGSWETIASPVVLAISPVLLNYQNQFSENASEDPIPFSAYKLVLKTTSRKAFVVYYSTNKQDLEKLQARLESILQAD